MDIFNSISRAPPVIHVMAPPTKRTRLSAPAPAPSSSSSQDRIITMAQNNNLDPNMIPFIRELTSDYRREVTSLREKIQQLESAPKKEKQSMSSEYSDPDPDDTTHYTTISQRHVGMEDDGVHKLELMGLRTSLRPPNCDPSSWPWKDRNFPHQVSEPKRAASLFMDHLQGSKRPHPSTVFKAHDRTKAMRIKELLSKNGAAGHEPEFRFAFAGQDKAAAQKAFKSERDWRLPEVTIHVSKYSGCEFRRNSHPDTFSHILIIMLSQDTFDVMDALFNHNSLVYACRPWSYEAHSLHRALHECRYYFNVATDSKQQKKLLLGTIETVWSENTSRAESSRYLSLAISLTLNILTKCAQASAEILRSS